MAMNLQPHIEHWIAGGLKPDLRAPQLRLEGELRPRQLGRRIVRSNDPCIAP
jgi:hypothetical protein